MSLLIFHLYILMFARIFLFQRIFKSISVSCKYRYLLFCVSYFYTRRNILEFGMLHNATQYWAILTIQFKLNFLFRQVFPICLFRQIFTDKCSVNRYQLVVCNYIYHLNLITNQRQDSKLKVSSDLVWGMGIFNLEFFTMIKDEIK